MPSLLGERLESEHVGSHLAQASIFIEFRRRRRQCEGSRSSGDLIGVCTLPISAHCCPRERREPTQVRRRKPRAAARQMSEVVLPPYRRSRAFKPSRYVDTVMSPVRSPQRAALSPLSALPSLTARPDRLPATFPCTSAAVHRSVETTTKELLEASQSTEDGSHSGAVRSRRRSDPSAPRARAIVTAPLYAAQDPLSGAPDTRDLAVQACVAESDARSGLPSFADRDQEPVYHAARPADPEGLHCEPLSLSCAIAAKRRCHATAIERFFVRPRRPRRDLPGSQAVCGRRGVSLHPSPGSWRRDQGARASHDMGIRPRAVRRGHLRECPPSLPLSVLTPPITRLSVAPASLLLFNILNQPSSSRPPFLHHRFRSSTLHPRRLEFF